MKASFHGGYKIGNVFVFAGKTSLYTYITKLNQQQQERLQQSIQKREVP